MNYSVRFRLYTTLIAIIVLTAVSYGGREVYNKVFSLSATSVPISEMGDLPKDTLILITSHWGASDDGLVQMPSRIITPAGKVLRESTATSSYQIASLWNGDQYIVEYPSYIDENNAEAQQPTWFTYKNEELHSVMLPEPCTKLPEKSPYEHVGCATQFNPSLSPDQKELLLMGSWSNQKDAQNESFAVIWNRVKNTWSTLQLSDLPVSEEIKKDPNIEMSVEWEKNAPETLFIIVQKENEEHQQVQLARFQYSVESKKVTAYALNAEYGPLMAPGYGRAELNMSLAVPQAKKVSKDTNDTGTVIWPTIFTYQFEGTNNPFTPRSIALVNTETLDRTELLQWRQFLKTDTVNVIALDTKPETEWFAVAVNDQLYITKRGSGKHALIGTVPVLGGNIMGGIYELDAYTNKK